MIILKVTKKQDFTLPLEDTFFEKLQEEERQTDTASLLHHYDVGKRYQTTMSLQSQYIIGLNSDVNPTKNRCRHNIACPLGTDVIHETRTQQVNVNNLNPFTYRIKIIFRRISAPMTA